MSKSTIWIDVWLKSKFQWNILIQIILKELIFRIKLKIYSLNLIPRLFATCFFWMKQNQIKVDISYLDAIILKHYCDFHKIQKIKDKMSIYLNLLRKIQKTNKSNCSSFTYFTTVYKFQNLLLAIYFCSWPWKVLS